MGRPSVGMGAGERSVHFIFHFCAVAFAHSGERRRIRRAARKDRHVAAARQALRRRHRDAEQKARVVQAKRLVRLRQTARASETQAFCGEGAFRQRLHILARPITLAAARPKCRTEEG